MAVKFYGTYLAYTHAGGTVIDFNGHEGGDGGQEFTSRSEALTAIRRHMRNARRGEDQGKSYPIYRDYTVQTIEDYNIDSWGCYYEED